MSSARAIRRAAERLISKNAAAQNNNSSNVSEVQLAANRANAQHSTGPQDPAMKSKVSMNALRTGLTGRTVLLPTDDAVAYQAHMEKFQTQFKPVGVWEEHLVQSLVDITWRLDRIPGLEFALLASAQQNIAEGNPELLNEEKSFVESQIRINSERQFRNLHLQENRLVRRRDKEFKQLMEMQLARKQAELEQARLAAEAAKQSPAQKATPNPNPVNTSSQNGFEFATAPPKVDLTDILDRDWEAEDETEASAA